ncbi:MAG: response regulator transcription factor [Thermoflexales bacterium]|nr:response regulator transcription factor [Thermoflexales bacterium]
MKILLVDDPPLFIEGIQNLLHAHGRQVVGIAQDGLDALDKARELRPDLILMDVRMPRCDGLRATRLIKAELPEITIVMLTVSEDDENLFEAIKSGASGYLLKDLKAALFLELLSSLEHGVLPFSPGLAAKILEQFKELSALSAHPGPAPGQESPLTPRQAEILALAAQGLSYRQIGAQLGLAESTVKNHMSAVMERLHLQNRAQVIAYAERARLVP